MKKLFTVLFVLTVSSLFSFTPAQAQQQWNPVNLPNNGYMSGHPSNNSNYYNPHSTRSNRNSPNYNSDYYNQTYNYNGNYQRQGDSTPYGNSIGDYNPYYDRHGNRK